ncbi:MAG: sialidase family protein [Gemmatimonadota bacterium]
MRSLARLALAALVSAFLFPSLPVETLAGQQLFVPEKVRKRTFKGRSIQELVSSGALAMLEGPRTVSDPGSRPQQFLPPGRPLDGRGINAFVNDPCMDVEPDPSIFPFNFFDVMQSETEIAVWNPPGGPAGRYMVVGYNDSEGFTTNTRGLSGFSYSIDEGRTWIDGGGLPVHNPDTRPAPEGQFHDVLFGDPVVVVHHATGWFYYSSLYLAPDGFATLAVSRGRFRNAPPQGVESVANTRCLKDPALHQVPLPPSNDRRIIWEKPIVAVDLRFLCPTMNPIDESIGLDFLDKEWIHVDQATGCLYLTYTSFQNDFSLPIEIVTSCDGGRTWTDPVTVRENPATSDYFNQATMPITTPTGRLLVVWLNRTFDLTPPRFPEVAQEIQLAYSDDGGQTWSEPITVADVNPQGEPRGYNRDRPAILNQPWIAVDLGSDDGVIRDAEAARPGFGNVYVTYFDGFTALPATRRGDRPLFAKAGEIHLSTSIDDGATWGPEVLVNDDGTETSHVFPTVQAAKDGEVYVAWIDRRLDPANNVLTDTWAAVSTDLGASFSVNQRQSNDSASWFVRVDAIPNFGDYNSSELIGFSRFVTVWADGRFPPPFTGSVLTRSTRPTPDVRFTLSKGLGFD